MANIFLDANILVDLLEKRKNILLPALNGGEIYVSTLSIHIVLYVTKQKILSFGIEELLSNINLIDFTSTTTQKAITGPTADFEDNVQLHSAAEAECDVFLTSDKSLLKMKFFGKTKIISPEEMTPQL